MNVQNVKRLLALLAGGGTLDKSWEAAGYSSREEAIRAIESLSKSLGEEPPAGKRRGVARAILHTDGASRGNPGPSAVAAVIHLPTGEELASVAKKIGRATNNVAEYRAVIEGMKLAREHRRRRAHGSHGQRARGEAAQRRVPDPEQGS